MRGWPSRSGGGGHVQVKGNKGEGPFTKPIPEGWREGESTNC